ncbi:MAG: hypothetical protein KC713_01335, partial [Candidatus Omnitrophica bacterium]|nr:hypothetical protein [Candidatus Omnitrophota bacterium]
MNPLVKIKYNTIMYSYRNPKNLLRLTALFLCLVIYPLTSYSGEEPAPSLKEQKAQEGYVLNLKELIKKSKKKIEQVNDKLADQAKQRRNQQREEKAREYYEKAMRLFEEGKFDEAKEYWNKAIKITEHPEMRDYIREDVRKTEKKEKALKDEEQKRLRRLEIERGYSAKEVEEEYQRAVQHYKLENFIEARNAFEHVEDMFPDHKATRSYLMIIEQEIKKEQAELIETRLREESIARTKAKERWRQEIEEKEQRRQKELFVQVNTLYEDAVKLHKAKQFKEAKEKFKEVEWLQPDFKATNKYLSHIDEDIDAYRGQLEEEKFQAFQELVKEEKLAKEEQARLQKLKEEQKKEEELKRRKDEAGFVYNTAVKLYKQKDYIQALDRFSEVQRLYPGYKSTDDYLRKIEQSIQDNKIVVKSVQKNIIPAKAKQAASSSITDDPIVLEAIKSREARASKEIQDKYDLAVKFYDQKNFIEAKRKFIAVEALYPNFKKTLDYLARIDDDIATTSVQKYQSTPLPEKEVEDVKADEKKERKSFFSFFKRRAINEEEHTNDQVEEITPQAVSSKQTSSVVEDDYVQRTISEREKSKFQDAQNKYQQALDLYNSGHLQEAKNKFISVEAIYPNFKDTLKYL